MRADDLKSNIQVAVSGGTAPLEARNVIFRPGLIIAGLHLEPLSLAVWPSRSTARPLNAEVLGLSNAAGTRLFTCRGNDWTDRYQLVGECNRRTQGAVMRDRGEIAVCDDKGLPVFDLLRHGPRVKRD